MARLEVTAVEGVEELQLFHSCVYYMQQIQNSLSSAMQDHGYDIFPRAD